MSETSPQPAISTPGPVAGLDLAQGRVIRMQFGAHLYTWTFRRVLAEDWKKLFESFATEATHVLGEEVETFEVTTGTVELARSCVVSVEGYKLPENPDLKKILPHAHLLSFGMALRDVRPSPPTDDEPLSLSELHEVSLDCTWSASEGGGMTRWTGLWHRFNTPTLAQQRAYNRALNTHRVMGDERGGRTIYANRQVPMMKLYDELIDSVSPEYLVNGQPLADRAAIVREMDGCHKVAAIQAFLNAGGTGEIVAAKPARKEGEIVQ